MFNYSAFEDGIHQLTADEIDFVAGGPGGQPSSQPSSAQREATGDAILAGIACAAGIGAMALTSGGAVIFVGIATAAQCLQAAELARRAAGCEPYSDGSILACG